MDKRPRRAADTIARHAAQSLLPTVLGIAVSLAVVRGHGAEAWGRFVAQLLVWQLAAHVVGWGNKDQVVRAVARDGADLGATFRAHLRARVTLLLPVTALAGWLFGLWNAWPQVALVFGALWLALRAVSQSFEAVILVQQHFLRAAAVEAAATLVVLGCVLGGLLVAPGAAVTALLGLFVLGETMRVAGLSALFPLAWMRSASAPPPSAHSDSWAILRGGVPFFLMGAAGMVGSRVDLYCVSALLPAAEVARYQMLVNALLWLQSIAGLMLLPFARTLYRMAHHALWRLNLRFLALGVVIALPGVAVVGLLMRHGYGFDVDAATLAVSALYVAQMFAQTPAIYAMLKAGLERKVLGTTVAVTVGNLALNLVLIPRLGALGALVASTVVGWGAAAAYLARARKLSLQTDLA